MKRIWYGKTVGVNWGITDAAIVFALRIVLGLVLTRLLLAPLGLNDYLSIQVLDSITLIALVTLLLRWRRVSLSYLFKPTNVSWGELITTGVWVGIILLGLGNWGESWVKANLLADLGPHPLYQLTVSADRLGQFVLPFLIGGFLVPLAEELFYRGILYPPFKRKFGVVLGILICGLIFALAHFDQVWLIEVFLVGVVLTYLYHRFRSIVPGLIAHIILNGGRLIMIYLAL